MRNAGGWRCIRSLDRRQREAAVHGEQLGLAAAPHDRDRLALGPLLVVSRSCPGPVSGAARGDQQLLAAKLRQSFYDHAKTVIEEDRIVSTSATTGASTSRRRTRRTRSSRST